MNGTEWALKTQSEIYLGIQTIKHLRKIGAISVKGEKSEIDWCGPL